MLLEEWNIEDAKVVWREEGREDGLEEGLVKGINKSKIEIARNALAEGFTPEIVQKITGLSEETIIKLKILKSER